MNPDTAADLLKAALGALGTVAIGALGFVVKWLRERRDRPVTDTNAAISITNDLQELAAGAVADVKAQMKAMRAEHAADREEDRQATADAVAQMNTAKDQLIESQRQTQIAQEQTRQAERHGAAQIKILLTHIRVLDDWAQRYYADGHPPGMEPPPKLAGFQQ